MKHSLNRRLFLKRAALVASAFSATRFLPNVLQAVSPSDKLNCALIGCGGRGMTHLSAIVGQNLVAIVDVNEKRTGVVKKNITEKDLRTNTQQTITATRR